MTAASFTEAAQADLQAARLFYAEHSEEQGARFLAEIAQAVDRILSSPEAWPLVTPRLRRYVLRRFPYLILFQVRRDGSVLIAAVAHHRQDPASFRQR